MGSEYLSYVKSIATFALTFYGCNYFGIASVLGKNKHEPIYLFESKAFYLMLCMYVLFKWDSVPNVIFLQAPEFSG